jgi:hypothetical protein
MRLTSATPSSVMGDGQMTSHSGWSRRESNYPENPESWQAEACSLSLKTIARTMAIDNHETIGALTYRRQAN